MVETNEKESKWQKAKDKTKATLGKAKAALTPNPEGLMAKTGDAIKSGLNPARHKVPAVYGGLNALDTWNNGGSALEAGIEGVKGYGEGLAAEYAVKKGAQGLNGAKNLAVNTTKQIAKNGLKQTGKAFLANAGSRLLATPLFANPYTLAASAVLLPLVGADAYNMIANDKPSTILNTLGLVKESAKKLVGMDDRNAIDEYGQNLFDAVGKYIPEWLTGGGKAEDMKAAQARTAESNRLLEEFQTQKKSGEEALKANTELSKKSNKQIRALNEANEKEEKIKEIETELGLRQAEQEQAVPFRPARGEIVERLAPEQLPQSVSENPDNPHKWAVPEGHGLIKNSKGEYIHVAPPEYRAADQYGGGITDRWEETQAYIDKQARENEAEKQLLRNIATAPWYSPQMQANAVRTLDDMLRNEEVQAKGLNASLYDQAAQNLIDQDNNLTKLLANNAEGKYDPALYARLLQEKMSHPDRLQGVNLADPVQRQRYLAQQLAISGVNNQIVKQFGNAAGLNNVDVGRTTFDTVLDGLGLRQPELPMVNGEYVDTSRLSPAENAALQKIGENNQKFSILQELQRERDEAFGRAK